MTPTDILAANYETATNAYLAALHRLSDDRLSSAEIDVRMHEVEQARTAWNDARVALQYARRN